MKTILNDLLDLLAKYRKEKESYNVSHHSVRIKGYTYDNQEQIIDAYGCCFITKTQKEKAIQKLKDKARANHDRTYGISMRIKYMEQLIVDFYRYMEQLTEAREELELDGKH